MTNPIPTWRETLGNSPTLIAAGAVGQAMQQEIDALRTENERMTKQCNDYAASEYKTKLEAQTTFDALRTRLAEVEKDAALGLTAMRFVDRAGDVHPGIDDAETICADFYKAMMATLEKNLSTAQGEQA